MNFVLFSMVGFLRISFCCISKLNSLQHVLIVTAVVFFVACINRLETGFCILYQ